MWEWPAQAHLEARATSGRTTEAKWHAPRRRPSPPASAPLRFGRMDGRIGCKGPVQKNRSTREAGCDLYWRVTLEKAMAIIGELRDTVALQAAHIEALTGQNAELQRQNTELQRQNAELTQRVTQLEERLNQNSGNSDKPPSSDSVFRSPKTEANRRKRKRKKRAGKARQLLPTEAVDQVVVLVPDQCQHCGDSLTQDDVVGRAQRHQVTEIPEPKADVTEYQLHQAHCALPSSDPCSLAGRCQPFGLWAPIDGASGRLVGELSFE